MSNNLVSHSFTIPKQQMDQLQPIFSTAASQQLSMPNMQTGLSEPMSHSGVSQNLMMHNHMGYTEPKTNYVGSQEFVMPNNELREMEVMLNNSGSRQMPALIKQKSPMGPLSGNSMPQQVLMPTRKAGELEHRPWLKPFSAPNKSFTQVQSNPAKPMPNIPTSQQLPAPNKRTVQQQPTPNRPGLQKLSTPKNHTAQIQPSPKAQTESNESVRSKLRESLTAALALVTEEREKPSKVEKKIQVEAAITSGQTQENSQSTETDSSAAVVAEKVAEKPRETSISAGDIPTEENIVERASHVRENAEKHECDGQEFRSIVVSPDEDVAFTDSFFVKDDLLQGNGLSWALDFDNWVAEKENQTAKKQKVENKDVPGGLQEKTAQSPQSLALKIELELFKLFGGVNKKYKEKGRSLLFNLKDRSNPELREKVMSGEISPKRLCSMTAEELASKELSEWRIAKAEELAQMVVLPDSDVDIRRLVKKTHKGEFQVEVEQDDSVSVEVSVGSSSLHQNRSKASELQAHSPSKPEGTKDEVLRGKVTSEEQDSECTFTIPSSESNDLMQGLMVDELKDAEFLPPIVSLDEFMESLDAEPPFEILPVDADGKLAISKNDPSEVGSESKSSNHSLKAPANTSPDKHDKVDDPKPDANAKSSEKKDQSAAADAKSSEKKIQAPEAGCHDSTLKGEHVWEGLIQLNLSATITVTGFFKSGEKTSTREWPALLEIKGRVRLDAFEKFLQELRMSRSRAIMVVHFVQKEGSPKSESSNLREVADSYVSDERVGFAEPAPGVELYLCPPHSKILEKFQKHLLREHTEALNSTIDKGLIGVIVWRKAHLTSTISPNSSSHHHKHSFKKQHHHNTTSSRRQEKDSIMNPKKRPMPFNSHPTNHVPSSVNDDDDDGDVPPGFGPPVSRDDDDLPEYNFSGDINLAVPSRNAPYSSLSKTQSRPVDQMRELVYKYGQTGNSVTSRNPQEKRAFLGVQPWNNDDDDDDIPEWQPEQHLPPPPPSTHLSPSQLHSYQQPMLQPHMVNHQQNLRASTFPQPIGMSMPPTMNVMQGQQNTWKAPSGSQQTQYYGTPRNRGF